MRQNGCCESWVIPLRADVDSMVGNQLAEPLLREKTSKTDLSLCGLACDLSRFPGASLC
jgi:hypothetical protein